MKGNKIVIIVAQIFAYILAIILIIQLWKSLVGGTWAVEDVILAFVVFNLTATFTMFGYLMYVHVNLSNKISKIDAKIESHVSWHRGHDSKLKK